MHFVTPSFLSSVSSSPLLVPAPQPACLLASCFLAYAARSQNAGGFLEFRRTVTVRVTLLVALLYGLLTMCETYETTRVTLYGFFTRETIVLFSLS